MKEAGAEKAQGCAWQGNAVKKKSWSMVATIKLNAHLVGGFNPFEKY